MNNIHTEKTFEEAIEQSLLTSGKYIKGNPDNFDRNLAIDKIEVITFIKSTQSNEWEKLSNTHGKDVETKFIQRLNKELELRGMLDVLRNGITDYGIKFQLAYFMPETSLNPDTEKLYQLNRLLIYRQVHYDRNNENSLDMMIALNGLPIATFELKNQFTHQDVNNAKWQYKTDRNPKEPIFQFKKRALVHFALDTDEVYMTTKLSGKKTRWLPFNLGHNDGKGNPVNPQGYRTSYLWENILNKDSLMDIIGKYLHLQKEEITIDDKKIIKEAMIFPRLHQLDCVRKLIKNAKENGVGINYLIQHSAGSGKSNSIAWLSYRLSSLHNKNDDRVFDSVIVITDRTILDSQLQDTIYQFEHKQGVVQKIDKNSTQLAEALKAGSNIIITTLQKFPFVLEKVGQLPERKYAVIVDEAHSSQGGEATKKLKEVLSAKSLEEAENEDTSVEDIDPEDIIRREIEIRGQQKNLSFFGFTATPKSATLEFFGVKDKDGKPKPFHLYSMKQAIEEGFIHDVLKNYTTYKTFFKLSKEVQDDPEVDKKKAKRAIARFVSLHPHNLAQKTEVIIEHFKQKVMHKIGGKAKAMLVTSSRLHAFRYFFEFNKYIKENNYSDIKILVAFSGKVKDPDLQDKEYSEPDLTGFPERQLREKFASSEYKILIVADKYQTGFDQPLLHTMYVDKKLSGVKAVQTLSRLNRIFPGKEDTFILDFVNSTEDMQEAFQPFYKMTAMEETTDPNQLYDLKNQIEGTQVIWKTDIDNFCNTYFKSKKSFTPKEQGKLNAYIDPSVDRFKNMTDKEEKDMLENALSSFVKMYSYLSQIVTFQDIELEKLFIYCRFLIAKLPKKKSFTYKLNDEVALEYYRLQKIKENEDIYLLDENVTIEPLTVGSGASSEDEKEQLSEIIKIINERFATEFEDADRLFFEQVEEDCIADEELMKQAKANTIDNFELPFKDKFLNIVIDRMEQNKEIFSKIMDDKVFSDFVKGWMLKRVYGRLNEGQV